MSRDSHESSCPVSHSFLLRIWREASDDSPDGDAAWRGRIQHVASGQVIYVQDVAGLLGFLERWVGRLRRQELRQKGLH